MKYYITCMCGQNVEVDAHDDKDAVTKLIPAMDEHVAAKPHPQVPKDLTHEQKEGMVKSTMKKG